MSPMKESNETIYKMIGACMEVHRLVGPGFPIDVYKKALAIELKEKGLEFEADKEVELSFKETLVGTYPVDFFVQKSVVLVVKSQAELTDLEIQQVLRFMGLLDCQIGLLMNFGSVKIQYKRVLPARQNKESRNEGYRPLGYRMSGKTREGNPIS